MTPRTPRIPLTREQVREVDRLAIEELGIPGVVLMENAGRNATDAIQRYMVKRGKKLDSALIFCGGGNNGGDGYVIARHLHNQGVQVRILTTKPIDQLTGDAAINATICRNMNLDIQPAAGSVPLGGDPVISSGGAGGGFSRRLSSWVQHDLIVDALLGTGFTGNLRPDLLNLIQAINATRDQPNPPVIVAIDLPSGLNCDTGQPPDSLPDGPAQSAVRADLTTTFAAPKIGFTQPSAKPYLGHLEVAGIGIPPELITQMTKA
jgi:NAD(P)H-hydrate epimerase